MDFRKKLLLAPLAGITDTVFRSLCRENGADVVVTEMVSAKALIFGDAKSLRLLDFDASERPIGVQIFGSDVDEMGRAAGIVAGMGFDFVDLNMGCPARKVTGGGSGSALLADPGKAGLMVAACVASTGAVPVTVKLRTGFGETETFLEVASGAFAAGAAAVTLHPRTRHQMFSGHADWSNIARLKAAFPGRTIIGNGDVKTADDAARMMAETGCDAVMIGRAALGDPWFFRGARAAVDAFLAGNDPSLPSPPTPEERKALVLRHGEELHDRMGVHGIVEMRKHLAWYSRGAAGAARFRGELVRVADIDTLRDVVGRFF